LFAPSVGLGPSTLQLVRFAFYSLKAGENVFGRSADLAGGDETIFPMHWV
jgi:hypothetical protein